MNLETIEQIKILGNSLNILYVEDEELIREQIKQMLKRIFGSVEVASNGKEAFEKYMKGNYDLILTDIEMPYMDGIVLSQKIIEHNAKQQIMVISAHKNVNQLIDLIDVGIVGLIIKPIDLDKFIQKMDLKIKEIYANKIMKSYHSQMKMEIDKTFSTVQEIHKKDPLTSVYNFNYLEKCLNNDEMQAGILFNINDFKLINEYYSHNHGNHLLSQLAKILLNEAKKYAYDVFRVSSDEFLLLSNQGSVECEQVEQELKNIFLTMKDTKYTLIGIEDIKIEFRASYSCSKDRLLEELNIAIEYAKQNAYSYVAYSDCKAFHHNIQNIVETKKLLNEALKKSQIVPVFQPILMNNKEVKYEVLMRIEDSSHDLLTPDKFLDVAKSYNYYNEISEMLIFKAIDAMRVRKETFSINISFLDIKNSLFINRLEQKILKANLANRIVFEIIESEMLDDMDLVVDFIKRFKKLGVKFAIDDFGSGYSNFAYIFQLHPDFIKIDGSLIINLLTDHRVHTSVISIIELAHKLNIEVIAEFVSNKEIFEELTRLGVDAMQGYYIGLPDKQPKNIRKEAA